MPSDKPTPCSPMSHPVVDSHRPLERWPIIRPVEQESSRERFEREYLGKVMDTPRVSTHALDNAARLAEDDAYERGYTQGRRDAEMMRESPGTPGVRHAVQSDPDQGKEFMVTTDLPKGPANMRWFLLVEHACWEIVGKALVTAVSHGAITQVSAEALWHHVRGLGAMSGDATRREIEAFAAAIPSKRVIQGEEGPYLTRYIVGEPPDGGAVYLHCFHRSDADRELHNHPWSGVAHILVGGYREERRGADGRIVTTEYRPGDVNRIAHDTFHRVDLLEPETWTLFFAGPRVQDWGFWSRARDVFTPWREALARRGLL